MGEDDGVDAPWIDRKRGPVSEPQLLESLEQSPVDEDPGRAEVHEILRTGHRAGGAKKRQRYHSLPVLPSCSIANPAAPDGPARFATYPMTILEVMRAMIRPWTAKWTEAKVRTLVWVAVTALVAGLGSPVSLGAQQKRLSLDDIYDPARRVNFSGAPPADLTWIDATRFVTRS